MEPIINGLVKIIKNYKKSGSRGYQIPTLELKLEEIEILHKQFLKLLESNVFKSEETENNKIIFNKYYRAARTLIENALVTQKGEKNTIDNQPQSQSRDQHFSDSLENTSPILAKMANQQFNLETAIKVIPEFTGNYKDLKSFLTIIELINNNLAEDHKKTLIDFVFNVKLTNTVRTSLGASAPATLHDLINLLSSRYKSTKTVAQIQSSLSTFCQKTMKVETYNEKLLSLIAELNELQTTEITNCTEVQANTIKLINENYALNIFKNGLNGELKPTVFASRPKSLNDAVQLALELEKDLSNNTDQVLYFSNGNNRNYNNRNRYRNNNESKRHHYKNNSDYNTHNNYNRNNNSNNNRNYNNNRNSYNNNGNGSTNNRNVSSGNNNRNSYNNNGRNSSNNHYVNNNRTSYGNHNHYNRNNNRNVHCIQENSENPEVN